jgi:hypothetical protein
MKRQPITGQCMAWITVDDRCTRPATNTRNGFAFCKPHAEQSEGYVTKKPERKTP